MQGLMMDDQLLLTAIMRHAEQTYPDQEIVSVTADNPRHRYRFRDAFQRCRKLARGLQLLGASPGDRIGTLAWNDYRHLEIYYATSCSGLVCHTINPRLFPDQIEYIINHAQDRWLFIDPMFVPLLEKLSSKLVAEGYVVLCPADQLPDTSLPNCISYEQLLEECTDEFEWPALSEQCAAALCYTSGTTGNPKGVLYSHRAMVVHTYATLLPDVFGVGRQDVVLPIVPMFHVNAWSLPYGAVAVGAKLVLPGPKMADGETLTDLINTEGVTISAGVPTVWLALLGYLRESGKSIESLTRVVTGGSACPWSIMEEFEQEHGVYTHHAWGMTEMSPLGTYNARVPDTVPADKARALRMKQGRAAFGVEMRIVDDAGTELPRDGIAFGALQVRGPWVCERYFRSDKSALTADGWFDTGDVATIDPDGYLGITDRTKDVIKSGGEWISSIELENLAVGQPDVAEAAVIGAQHPKWAERPLLLVVPEPGANLAPSALLAAFEGKVASWWIPDDCVIVESLPHTATGKISKKDLRTQFENHQWPQEEPA
ncbi:long-chain-fatty-acid--CoA ligase [Biformimicrobium ophioploci]|uniref:3-(Methylthio)propionyl-CoA ligase n=1 Tax=Biformimicrobium ophioploci TaxID=3036711 RepID=A0ABQ6LYI4_9GAMM|nr:long-chain-fatty-acid--CoA ligase [Microbulbifer sp. NKW57]GMG87164.1 3-(methylthio)propionyl-CoA ligase [Microbulbifer sp. NKW57]